MSLQKVLRFDLLQSGRRLAVSSSSSQYAQQSDREHPKERQNLMMFAELIFDYVYLFALFLGNVGFEPWDDPRAIFACRNRGFGGNASTYVGRMRLDECFSFCGN